MKKIYYLCLLAFASYFIAGCDRDEIMNPNTPVITNKGVYVLSEGGGTPGTSALSFYDIAADSFYASIFSPGSIGNSPDGLIRSGSNLYMTEQGNFGGAGKVYKLDSNGIVLNSAVVGTNPYSLAEANGKLYITNGPASNVSIVDKNSLSLITTVTVGVYPQEIFAYNNKVFVCNTSTFGGPSDSTVSVIDAGTDAVVSTIQLKTDPSSIALSKDNKLLIGCNASSNAYIFKIDPATYAKLDSFKITNGLSKDISVDNNSNLIYFIAGGFGPTSVIKYDLSARTESILLPTESPAAFYGLNYDYINSKLYLAVAPDFSSNGQLRIYNASGVLMKTLTTGGVAPRRIVFKN